MMNSIESTQLLRENSTLSSGSVQIVTLNEPISYGSGDVIKSGCNQIVCMESTLQSQLSLGCPETRLCELYCVSRDVLFSGSAFAKKFLKYLESIFYQSNNESNKEELLKLANSTDYKIFVLLPPLQRNSNKLSLEVLCAIMVHIESNLPSNIVKCGSNLAHPVPMCFSEWNVKTDIARMHGLHIINIATHPQYKRMGYGLRAVQLLKELYEGKFMSLEEKGTLYNSDEETANCQNGASELNSPLLLKLSGLKFDNIDFMSVFFSLTEDIFSFWKKADFVPLHIATTKGSDTVACAMFKALSEESNSYVEKNRASFINHLFTVLNSHCKKFPASLALSVLNSCQRFMNSKDISKTEVDVYLKPYNMKLLQNYCLRTRDLNTVIHLIPTIAKLYFKSNLKSVHLSVAQEAILLSYGLQNKSLDAVSKDLKLQSIQVIGLLNRTLKKIASYITGIIERSVESSLISTDVEMKPLEKDLDEELEEAAVQVHKQQKQLLDLDVSQYVIKGSEEEWQKAVCTLRKTLISIKSIKDKGGNKNPATTKLQKHKKQFKKRKN